MFFPLAGRAESALALYTSHRAHAIQRPGSFAPPLTFPSSIPFCAKGTARSLPRVLFASRRQLDRQQGNASGSLTKTTSRSLALPPSRAQVSQFNLRQPSASLIDVSPTKEKFRPRGKRRCAHVLFTFWPRGSTLHHERTLPEPATLASGPFQLIRAHALMSTRAGSFNYSLASYRPRIVIHSRMST